MPSQNKFTADILVTGANGQLANEIKITCFTISEYQFFIYIKKRSSN